ncbi:midasin-like [Pollicipes pollicipes]|uniref:midasin-like n=1 Tax=Pollicipes pollicipes TaxID=41117 RepID=UPI0018855F6D|nr:midasin-like [Pollicipes pollicipes]
MKDHSRSDLCVLLWNLYQYYSQFYAVVESHLKALRKPVEQKVKDFVKIARWNDVNFWSVKDTVKKSHRMVHKHVKEFQAVLAQPVAPALVDPDAFDDEANRQLGLWDREQVAPLLTPVNPNLYIARGKVAVSDCPYPEHEQLARLRLLYMRSRRLCRGVYSRSRLMDDVTTLSDITGTICETASELSKLNVDGVEDKDKRRKLVGHMKQRKRKAAVELYRTLADMGLSYRRGLVSWEKESTYCSLLQAPPVDVTSGDGRVSAAWRGCLKYECRAVSRMALLRRALFEPHRELGPQNLERMRGYSADLMMLVGSTRVSLAATEQHVSRLSSLLEEVTGLTCQPHPSRHATEQRRYRATEAHLLANAP